MDRQPCWKNIFVFSVSSVFHRDDEQTKLLASTSLNYREKRVQTGRKVANFA